jgi:peroxiredoxin Q/BCP
MIDLRKATKGRRMSKKTRKKSGKPPARKTSPGSKAPAKRAASKAGRPSAKKSSKNSKTGQTKASLKISSKAPKAAAAKSNRDAAARPTLMEGAKAPSFELPRDGGTAVSLADYAGQKLVLFFYPRADTPGCTKEAIDFTRLNGAFADVGTAVIGV